MRIAVAAAFLAASCGVAAAEYYVLHDMQSGKCSIEAELPSSATSQVLLNNKFEERKDAEAAMKDIPSCN